MQARTDPLVIGAVGGSGTRVFSRIVRHAGVFMGEDRDAQEDSRPMSPFYGEFTTDYLLGRGRLDDAWSAEAGERLTQCLRDHLEGLPGPDHPWGVKNSRSMLMLPFWHQHFPDMRFLHVLRDGRDMAYSDNDNQIRRHGRALLGSDDGLARHERAMLWWASVNSSAADYGERALGPNYLSIRLEDLCARPKRTIRSLFEFIHADAGMKKSVGEVRTPPTLGRWRDRPEAEVASLVAIGGSALERFGYASEPLG